MILQIKTERELIDSVNRINAELIKCQDQNKALVKRIKFMQEQIDKKPAAIKSVRVLSGDDVAEIINKHVTIHYVSKLYKKGK